MQAQEVTVVRVYLGEREGKLDALLECLRAAGVRGWTVYRAAAGYGQSGRVRSASLVDLALDLPLTVEFFDDAARVAGLLDAVTTLAGDGHVVYWTATATKT